MGAQLHYLRCTTATKLFWKICFLYAHKHVRSEPFLDCLHDVWHCCWCYVATCRNFFCIVHIYVLGPKPLRWNFIKIFLLSIWSGAHKFFHKFFDFAIFNHNLAKIVAPPSNKNENYLAHLKGQSLLKNAENSIKIDHKQQHKNLLKVYCIPLWTNSALALERDKKTDRLNKHHIFAPTAGMRCSISPNFAWW